MRAIVVSCDFADLLAITLPLNRRLFSEVVVVTTAADTKTAAVALANNATVFATDAFYADGAAFGKWQALEAGLDFMGREGWLTVLDADIIYPPSLVIEDAGNYLEYSNGDFAWRQQAGQLCTPLRRMWENLPLPFTADRVLPESKWKKFPIHRNRNEWAGYSLCLHASDPHAAELPWFEPWKNAGASDSFFQRRWPASLKVRPPFEVLHLGAAGQNWHGRAATYLDGTIPPHAQSRRQACTDIWATRRRNRQAGRDEFEGERI